MKAAASLAPPHTSTSVIPGYICRGIHFHVPEPIFRNCGGAGGPAHYTRQDSHYSGHDNDRRNDAPPPPAAPLLVMVFMELEELAEEPFSPAGGASVV